MDDERQLTIDPIVQISVQSNARTVSNIRNLSASLFGIAAGTLGLESYPGFLFYIVGTLLVQLAILGLRASGDQSRYFHAPVSAFWIGDAFGPLMSFVLTWTLFFGLIRA